MFLVCLFFKSNNEQEITCLVLNFKRVLDFSSFQDHSGLFPVSVESLEFPNFPQNFSNSKTWDK